ncbi:hypothetical protein [Hasllibacter sp. MH4015]|uniref:hypothetical protein n=1 Tax=Hasllibacter sp. MH4015 TaxID=2854029 RepID=UPI001CD51442|nr:hypothetical protein [Hasllibacter sp. MH4015]
MKQAEKRNKAVTGGSLLDRVVTVLEDGDLRMARTLVAEATEAPSASAAEIASAKARIALRAGDEVAARAIIVAAIEANPEATTLRTFLSEMMLAQGRASDVRPVMTHLGRPPSEREASEADDLPRPAGSAT